MAEDDAIKFATLHLEGSTHEWWYHGLAAPGHGLIDTYDEFCKRLVNRFDRKDLEVHFRKLAQLKQGGLFEKYVEEIQILFVMPDVTERRSITLFIEGLHERLRGLINAFDPLTLQEAIKATLNLETSMAKNKFF